MGNLLNWRSQAKELRVIYVVEKNKRDVYPIQWPESFFEFVRELHTLFPATKRIEQTKFKFRDACEFSVTVTSENTFQALVPKHRQIAPSVDLYYVTLESWLV